MNSPHELALKQVTGIAIGVCLLAHNETALPHEFAAAAEACGIDAFFIPENSHVPLERPGTIRQFEGIERLAHFHDPFASLGACAAVTAKITLGTGVCLMTQRDPWLTANAAAALDHLSGGRLVLGVAGGFIRESMEDFGSPFAKRWQVVRERVEAMKQIWAAELPAYAGDFVALDGSRPGITSHRALGPPVWIGSNSKAVPKRVARYADGWITVNGSYDGDAVSDLKVACADAGRDFDELTVALVDAPDDYDGARRAIERGYSQLHYFIGGRHGDGAARDLDRVAELTQRLKR